MGSCSSSQDVVIPFPGAERPSVVSGRPIYKWTQGPFEESIEINNVKIEFYEKRKPNYNYEEPTIPGQVN